MSEFEKPYNLFTITPGERDRLRSLAEPPLHLRRSADRLVVETVIVDNGKRRVVRTEVQSA